MNRKELVKTLILSSRRVAAEDMAAIRSHAPLTKAFFSEKLRDFVLHKYMLADEPDLPEDFSDLTELSLARSLRISPDLVKEFDLAKSCDGASSAMAKKVLLFMAIQRELGIELPARESARIATLRDLADLAWEEMKTSPEWEGRLAPQN